MLPYDEQLKLIKAAQGGDVAARNRMIEENIGFIYLVTSKAVGRRRRDDFIADAIQGYIRALEGFKPDKGFKFNTYAGQSVYRACRRAAQFDHTVKPVAKGNSGKMSEEALRKSAIAASGAVSLDVSRYDAGEYGRRTESTAVDDECGHSEIVRLMKHCIGLLDDRSQYILMLRFDQDVTLDAVARRLGVTRDRVRQIQNAALWRLGEMMRRAEAA